MGARLVAVMMVTVALAGPFQSLALAQQPSQPPPSQPPQVQPAQPQLYQGGPQTPPPTQQRRARRGSDLYDVGAGAMTVVGMPLKALSCGLGVVLGFGLFIATVGSGERATAAVVEEGCDQNWIVRGDDIRPEASRHDRIRDRYDADLR